MASETKIKQFRIHELTKEQFNALSSKGENDLYLIPEGGDSQTKLFRHTFDIKNSAKTNCLRVESTNTKNTPISSIQDLTTLYATTDLKASGLILYNSKSYIVRGLDLEGGTVANIKIICQELDTGADTSLTFVNAFGASGFTIEDDVTSA